MSAATVWVDDHFIAGDVALDLANTVFRRTPELGPDLLSNGEALNSWLAHAKLLPARPHDRDQVDQVDQVDPDVALDQAGALREWFWAAFDAQVAGRTLPAEAIAGLFDVARRGAAHVAVEADGSATPLTKDGVLAVLALRGIRLLLSPPDQEVRTCDRCGWFFIDLSRGR